MVQTTLCGITIQMTKHQTSILAALAFMLTMLATFVLNCSWQKQLPTLPPQAKALSFALKAKAQGQSAAVLPPELADLSVDGKIYITKRSEAHVVLWQTKLGKAGHFHGVVYWEGTEPKVEKLELNAPSAKGVVKWEITNWQKAQAEHWAYVSTDFGG